MKEKCRTWGWASVGGDEWLEITNSDPLRCQRQSSSSSSRHLPSDSRVVPMPPSAQHQLLVQELSVATLSSWLGCSGTPVQLCGPPKPPAVQPQQWAARASSLPAALVVLCHHCVLQAEKKSSEETSWPFLWKWLFVKWFPLLQPLMIAFCPFSVRLQEEPGLSPICG